VSREPFGQILPILKPARKRTKPRTVDLYEVWCAVLYWLRTGCLWRALPGDFPKWRTVHSYFAKWGRLDDERISLLCNSGYVGKPFAEGVREIYLTFLALLLRRS